MDWITPTIAGASALGSAAIGGASAAIKNKKTLKYTKQLMDYQWQNYGSPQALQHAYNEIGVNPYASEGLSPQQPQAQQPSFDSPGLAGLQAFMQFVPQMTSLIQSSYQSDILKNQVEGTELANKMTSFDLLNLKDEELKEIRQRIDNMKIEGRLNEKQIALVTREIFKTIAEVRGIDQDTELKKLDYAWKNRQFEEGKPTLETELLRHQSEYQDYLAKEKHSQSNIIGRQDQYDAAKFGVQGQLKIDFMKQVGKIQKEILNVFDPKTMSEAMEELGIPPKMRNIVGPIFQGTLLMLMFKMSSFISQETNMY